MKYFVLLAAFGELAPWDDQTPEEQEAAMAGFVAFDEACAAEADLLVGHNIIGFDIEILHEIYPWFDAKGIELCDTLILGEWGNNLDPVSKHGQCCDKCNTEFVIPMRLVYLYTDSDGLYI